MDTNRILRLTAARRHAADGTGKAIRVAAGISMSEVAEAIGVNETTIWRWEERKNRPRGDSAVRWAELLAELAADIHAAAK